MLASPSSELLAVADTPRAADAAVAALGTAGVAAGAIERLSGEAAARPFDASGARHGIVSRVVRSLQFSLVDQLPDLAWYEAALRDGRTVLRVRVTDLDDARRLGAILTGSGAHFVNHFGRFQTAALAPWRGPEPPVSHLMKR
jgi:hypothetical protein